MARDRKTWPRCLLWHDWVPGLRVAGERDPCAASLGQLADTALECVLGAYPPDADPSRFWDAEDLDTDIGEHPCVWTDGSREDYPTGGFWGCWCWCSSACTRVGYGRVLFGERRRSMVMLGWIAVVLLCLSLALFRRSSVTNFGCDFGFASLLASASRY